MLGEGYLSASFETSLIFCIFIIKIIFDNEIPSWKIIRSGGDRVVAFEISLDEMRWYKLIVYNINKYNFMDREELPDYKQTFLSEMDELRRQQ